MQPKPFDVNNPDELAAWKKWMTRFEDPDAFTDDEPQRMGSEVARAKPIRHQAVDILRARDGHFRPSEDSIQTEIVRLSAMQYLAMSLQPGTTKSQDGKTYVLNENHRWTRPETQDEIDARESQGLLDFVAPPRKQGNQNILDFIEPGLDQEEEKSSEDVQEYSLKTEPFPVTQIAPNGKEYDIEYAPGDFIFDQSAGIARVGRVVGYTEDPSYKGRNLLVQFGDSDEQIYLSPHQVLSENDFGKGKEKGTWKDAVRNQNNVKIKGSEYQVTNRFTGDGAIVLNKDGKTFEYGVHTGGYGGSSWYLREVDQFGNVQSFKDGKFSKIDPLAKQLGVSSLDGLRWLRTHDPQFSGQDPSVRFETLEKKAVFNFESAFRGQQAEERYNRLKRDYLEANPNKADALGDFPKLSADQAETAKKNTKQFLDAVDKGYNQKAKTLIASMSRMTLYPDSKTLSLFLSNGKSLSMQGCMVSGNNFDSDPDETGYERPGSSPIFISSMMGNHLKQNYLALSPDQRNLKEKLSNHYGFPESVVDSYIEASYPTDSFNPHDQEHTWLHEFGHAIDGPYHVFSRSPEWEKIFKKEIIGKAGSSRLVESANGTYKVKAETKLEDLKPGDVVMGSRIGGVESHYQDDKGNLKIKEVKLLPETKTEYASWQIVFDHPEEKAVPMVRLPLKNNYGEKNGIVLSGAKDGVPVPLSMYAMTDSREGWAEFSALIARRPDKAKQLFPKAYRFWQKKGLV